MVSSQHGAYGPCMFKGQLLLMRNEYIAFYTAKHCCVSMQ